MEGWIIELGMENYHLSNANCVDMLEEENKNDLQIKKSMV